MKTTDLFKINRSSSRLNESFSKTFGKKINLENFDLHQLQDARNKLRTQISQVRSESGFNENLENDAYTKAQWMLDAINAEILEREEFVINPVNDVEEGYSTEVEEFLQKVAQAGDYDMLYDAQMGKYGPEIEKVVQEMYDDVTSDTGLHPDDDFEQIYDRMLDNIEADYGDSDSDPDEGGETDDNYAMASAGFGSDEDYESINYEGSHQADTTMKHVKNPTSGEKQAAKDIKPGIKGYKDRIDMLKSAEKDGRLKGESAPPTAKGERMVKHIKKGYADDGKLTDKEKSIAYATAWKQHNKDKNEDMNTTEAYVNNAKDAINLLADLRKQSKMAELGQGDPVKPNQLVNDLWDVMQWIEHNMKESIETESVENSGEDMTKLHEGEIQQASAIVTAKTMVDRVGRWIEELSGMENDTLLQLGDSIRDEMGQEQAKGFIEAVAPAIQQALENLKTTREALASGVRTLTGEEQPANMLGGEPAAGDEEMGPVEPDAMNAELELGAEDDFAAAEPAAGGAEAAGREQRESIQFENRLLKVLAG
jgi:hypothetical protein